MKTLLLGINAKYIHTNLAIRLLKANTEYNVEFIEYTIKDDIEKIIEYVISNDYQILGISAYIWNIEVIKQLLISLRNKNKDIILILGGPEVSFDPHNYIINYDVNYVIVNEGEIAFDRLLKYLHGDGQLDIPNLVSKTYTGKSMDIKDLKSLVSPHYEENDNPNRISYIETSRGCPFNCSYCLASLESHVRFFDIENVKKDILYLQSQGTKVFKFLDRTFNTNTKLAIEVFSFIIDNHLEGNSFQFEITGDILHEDIIHYLNNNAPKNLFRFEIGIQSTNIDTNLAVNRIQDNKKLFKNINLIQDGNIIDLHLDLIAGLPKEDITSFEKTFNEVIALRPLELQLGFLKLLKGTKLRMDALKYNYVFQDCAPYEIISNDFMSAADLDKIRLVEEVLEKYYNSNFMANSIRLIMDKSDSVFNLFLDYGEFYQKNFSWTNYNLDDLFYRLYLFLKEKNYPDLNYLLFMMKYDYLSYFTIRPKIWWQKPIKKVKNKYITDLISQGYNEYSLEDLYRYSVIEEYDGNYLIVIYKANKNDVSIIKKR